MTMMAPVPIVGTRPAIIGIGSITRAVSIIAGTVSIRTVRACHAGSDRACCNSSPDRRSITAAPRFRRRRRHNRTKGCKANCDNCCFPHDLLLVTQSQSFPTDHVSRPSAKTPQDIVFNRDAHAGTCSDQSLSFLSDDFLSPFFLLPPFFFSPELRLVKRAFPRPVPMVRIPQRLQSCMKGISLRP